MSWRRFVHRDRWDDERARELRSYLDIETDENIARGMTSPDARAAAHRKLGNATLVREEIYRMNTIGFLDSLWQDLKYGLRLLRLNPGFACVAVLSLSLGVGANTAIFQLIDAVRVRTLPVHEPQDLVEVRLAERRGRTGSFTGRSPMLTNAIWERLRDDPDVFSGALAWTATPFDLSSGGEVRYADGLFVSGGFFPTLGVTPAAGRLLAPSDDQRDCAVPPAVISYPFWRREFGGDRSAIGRSVRVSGRSFEIAGVTPPGFFGVDVGRSYDVALPLCAEPLVRGEGSALTNPVGWFLAAFGRLKPGVSPEQATARLMAISPAIFLETTPPGYTAQQVAAYQKFSLAAFPAASGVSTLRGTYQTPLWVLLATTGLVLLVACANLANLMLARATAREREVAVRLALGASRRRIIRQLMSESLLLAGIGAACGALVAQWLSGFLVSFLSTDTNRVFLALQIDWRLFGFTALLAVVTCLLFGLAPALRATQAAPSAAMKTGSRGVTDSRERFALRQLLVVTQVALSLVLIVGALLFVRSLRNLMTVDLGFRPDGLVGVGVNLRRTGLPKDRLMSVYRELTDALRAVPGVQSAAQADIVPLSGSGWNENIIIGGVVQKAIPNFNRVGPGYFATFRTPFVAGRDFDSRDLAGSPPVAIVNESFAREFFAGGNPIGKAFQVEGGPGDPRPLYQIVGLVKDTKYQDVRDAFGPIAYVAAAQERDPGQYFQAIVRTSVPAEVLRVDIAQAVAAVNPSIAFHLDPIETLLRQALTPERLMATLSGFFGGLAGLIAAIGLYGVMSYTVTRRRNEIGIRMALGANRRAVVTMIVREGAALVAGGIVVGAALSFFAGRAAATLLFGLTPGDPETLALSIVALSAVAAAATWVPAARATRVDPSVVLRGE